MPNPYCVDIQESEVTGCTSFVVALKQHLLDKRDPRGKRHSLAFIVIGFVFATLRGRQSVSSVHRFLENQFDWLQQVTQIFCPKVISRAQLPRVLEKVDWVNLDRLIGLFFRPVRTDVADWVALDGKALRGSQSGDEKQSVVLAVSHTTREELACARQEGSKSSEINVLRLLLKESGLESNKISLDAHHCNPKTTRQINQAGGLYLTQVKENQPILLAYCKTLAQTPSALDEIVTEEDGHGRTTRRSGRFYSLEVDSLASRWRKSKLSTLIVIERETHHATKNKTTRERSFYVSNQSLEQPSKEVACDLMQAIQKHWSVESNNWIRDKTFGEDAVKVKKGNQSQIMARLRGMSIELIRKNGTSNFQAAIEYFMDLPSALLAILKKLRFL